jgi:hypothetical protein
VHVIRNFKAFARAFFCAYSSCFSCQVGYSMVCERASWGPQRTGRVGRGVADGGASIASRRCRDVSTVFATGAGPSVAKRCPTPPSQAPTDISRPNLDQAWGVPWNPG